MHSNQLHDDRPLLAYSIERMLMDPYNKLHQAFYRAMLEVEEMEYEKKQVVESFIRRVLNQRKNEDRVLMSKTARYHAIEEKKAQQSLLDYYQYQKKVENTYQEKRARMLNPKESLLVLVLAYQIIQFKETAKELKAVKEKSNTLIKNWTQEQKTRAESVLAQLTDKAWILDGKPVNLIVNKNNQELVETLSESCKRLASGKLPMEILQKVPEVREAFENEKEHQIKLVQEKDGTLQQEPSVEEKEQGAIAARNIMKLGLHVLMLEEIKILYMVRSVLSEPENEHLLQGRSKIKAAKEITAQILDLANRQKKVESADDVLISNGEKQKDLEQKLNEQDKNLKMILVKLANNLDKNEDYKAEVKKINEVITEQPRNVAKPNSP